ncbi:hypothetical protein [Polyangium aurulentum]|uniref:hypothetical protein n=1 Tax=Polyangium aurulentum TaxID=2567896 RepID=UPI0010AEDB36|nr:hypothetical protein [Polyangium aurulentum]UQA62138.1 hypothetical protein E8A73_017370 [Polyangium aurulentum]
MSTPDDRGAPETDWEARVRGASAGLELLSFLEKRLSRPYEEGPRLDDRQGEGPEEVFERMAQGDDRFRSRLDETIAGYFRSPGADPADNTAYPVIRALLETVQRLGLTGVNAPLRAWLQEHEAALLAEEEAYLARAALGALATSQPQNVKDMRDFWLRLWRSSPPLWQPRAFMGLRLQDPRAAAEEIPLLLRRVRERHQHPGPILHGMWNQQHGRDALLDWLRRNNQSAEAAEVRTVLRGRIPDADLDKLTMTSPRRPRRPLPSLAPAHAHDWGF